MSELKINSYPLHIGDWRSGTVRMSLAEEGAYLRLVNQYYLDGGEGWTVDEALRICCAITKDEQKAVRAVLASKFEKTDVGYRHDGCDKRIAKIVEFSDKKKARSKAGNEARWGDKKQSLDDPSRIASSTAESTPKRVPRRSQPIASSQKEGKDYQKSFPSVGGDTAKIPEDLRLRIAADERYGEDWCVSWLDRCRVDGDRLLAATATAVPRLKACDYLSAFEIVPPS